MRRFVWDAVALYAVGVTVFFGNLATASQVRNVADLKLARSIKLSQVGRLPTPTKPSALSYAIMLPTSVTATSLDLTHSGANSPKSLDFDDLTSPSPPTPPSHSSASSSFSRDSYRIFKPLRRRLAYSPPPSALSPERSTPPSVEASPLVSMKRDVSYVGQDGVDRTPLNQLAAAGNELRVFALRACRLGSRACRETCAFRGFAAGGFCSELFRCHCVGALGDAHLQQAAGDAAVESTTGS